MQDETLLGKPRVSKVEMEDDITESDTSMIARNKSMAESVCDTNMRVWNVLTVGTRDAMANNYEGPKESMPRQPGRLQDEMIGN